MKIITGLLIIIMVVFIFACDTTDLPEQVDTETLSISITPENKDLLRGKEQSFFVRNDQGKLITAIDWSIEGTDLKKDTRISSNGDLTIAANEDTPKIITVRAVFKQNRTIEAAATINLLAPIVNSVQINTESSYYIADWTKNHKIDVDINTTEQFSAKVIGENDPWNDVVWKIGQEIDGISFNDAGLLSVADNPLLYGSKFTIKAVSVEKGNKESEEVTVTIEKPEATELSIVFKDKNGRDIREVGKARSYIFDVNILGTGKIVQDVVVDKERVKFEATEFDDKIITGYYEGYDEDEKPILIPNVETLEEDRKMLTNRGLPYRFDMGRLVEDIDDNGNKIMGDGSVNVDGNVITVTINGVENKYEGAELREHWIKPNKASPLMVNVVIIKKQNFSSLTKITPNNKPGEYNLDVDMNEEFGTFKITANSSEYGMSCATPVIKITVINDEDSKAKEPR